MRGERSYEQIESSATVRSDQFAPLFWSPGLAVCFGGVLRAGGIGDELSAMLSNTGMPIIIAAFIISMALRVAQGSATVALLPPPH